MLKRVEEEVLSFLEASRSRKTRKSFFFLLFFHFFPFPPNLTFARAFRYALRCSFRFVFGTFTESAISAAREREKKRENKLKRKRKRRRRCSSSERDVFDVNVVTIIFSFSLSLSTPTHALAPSTLDETKDKNPGSLRGSAEATTMARAAVLGLLLAALVALLAAAPSSAAPCFHGGHRLTSAPITLKTAKKDDINGASSAHSSFDGVAEPVRESGYFKVSKGERREERKRKHEITGRLVRSPPPLLPTSQPLDLFQKKQKKLNSSIAPTTPTCSTCTSSRAPRRPRTIRSSSG